MIGFLWSHLANLIIAGGAVAAGVAGLVRYVVVPPFKFAQRLERSLTFVEKEMKPNGGGSLRDAVDTLVRRTDALETRVEAQERTDQLEVALSKDTPA